LTSKDEKRFSQRTREGGEKKERKRFILSMLFKKGKEDHKTGLSPRTAAVKGRKKVSF